MRISSRRGTIVFFLCLGIGLIALAVALNVGWIILNWREEVLLVFGIIFATLAWAAMHAAGVARRRIRLSTDQPIKALFETIGACGNPPKDDSYNFAVYAIVLLVLAWILVPAVLWFVVTHS